MRRRITSLFLVLTLCLTLLPTVAWAEEPDAELGDPAPFDLTDDAEGGESEVSEKNAVAEVGSIYYDDFAKAVAAANNDIGCTLKLLDDVQTISDVDDIPLYVDSSLTLDLNGHTLDVLCVGWEDDETGPIFGSMTVVDSTGGGGITDTLQVISGALKVKGGSFGTEDSDSASGLQVDNGTCTITGGTVWMLGSVGECTVDVSGGSIKGMSVGSGDCTVNITGGSGHCGSWSCSGVLNITGGSFGDVAFGDPHDVHISGGSFEKISAYGVNNSTFYLSALLADGSAFYDVDGTYIPVDDVTTLSDVTVQSHTHTVENGVCTVCGKALEAEAIVGGETRYYEKLEDAFVSENAGGTVTLLKDITRELDMTVTGGPYTLDLNGHGLASLSDTPTTLTVGKADGAEGDLTVIGGGKNGYLTRLVFANGSLTVESGEFGFVGDAGTGLVGTLDFKGGYASEFKISSCGDTTDESGNRVDGLTVSVSGGSFGRIESYEGSSLSEILAYGLALEGNDSILVDIYQRTSAIGVTVVEHTEHTYTDGVCSCGRICDHNFVDGKCTDCGYTCSHDVQESDGKYFCRICRAEMVARTGEGSYNYVYYTDIADALNNSADGKVITLLADASTDKDIHITAGQQEVLLDLNRYSLTCTGTFTIGDAGTDKYDPEAKDFATLGIYGSGTIDAEITVAFGGIFVLTNSEGCTVSSVILKPGCTFCSPDTEFGGTVKLLQLECTPYNIEHYFVKLGGGTFESIVNNTGSDISLDYLLSLGYTGHTSDGTPVKHSDTLKSGEHLYNVTVEECENHVDTTGSGKCDYCGKSADRFAASVTTTSGDTATVTYYPTLTEAISAAQNADGSIVKLLKNAEVTEDGQISIGSGSFTIDWNGFTLTGSSSSNLLVVAGKAKVTLKDSSGGNGGITNSGMYSGAAVCASVDGSGSVTIEGGTYSPQVIKQQRCYGTVSIKGGVFENPSTSGRNSALFAETGNLSDMLADGFAFAYSDDDSLIDAYSVSSSEVHRTVYVVEHTEHVFDDTTGKCACGYTCPHGDIDPDTGICNDCRMQMSVKVEVGDNISYYTDPQTAIDAAKGGTMTLLADVELKAQLKVPTSGPVTLDLNGKALTGDNITAALFVNGGDITVCDDSDAQTGTITSDTNIQAIIVFAGKLTITSGSFEKGVFIYDGNASISGGSFSYICTFTGKALSSILADGFSFTESHGTDAKYYSESGAYDVTVVEHTHKLTDGVCPCGYTCPHDWSDKTGKCTICGYACQHTDVTDSDGIYACKTCGQTMTAAVLAPVPDITVTYYGDGTSRSGLDIAFDAAKDGSSIIVLSGGDSVTAHLDDNSGKALTLILNGKDIGSLYVEGGGKNTLTVTGSGNIQSLSVYLDSTTDLTQWTGDKVDYLWVDYGAKVSLSGGTFGKIILPGSPKVGSLLAAGCAFRQLNDRYVDYDYTDSLTNVKVEKCENHVDASGIGYCDYCNRPASDFEASVGESGSLGASTVTYYEKLADAFALGAAGHGDVIKLMKNVDLGDDLIDTTLSAAEELDLNGKTISKSGSKGGCALQLSGSFTIRDSSGGSGKITSDSGFAVYVTDSSKLTVVNGNFGYVYFDGYSSAEIYGGSFDKIFLAIDATLGSLLYPGHAFADIGSNTVKNCYNDKQVENVHVIEHFHSGVPCACGYVCAHENGIDPATGKCPYCETFLAVASVTVGDTTTYYTDLQKAIDSASNGTVTLLQDITLADGATLNNEESDNVTLDMNRNSLIGTGVTVLTVSRDMTICGTGGRGTIYSDGSSCKSTDTINSVVLTGGHLTITGFGFDAFRDGGENRTLYATGGSLTIEYAMFAADVVIERGCTVEIKGGSFLKDVSIASLGAKISGGEFHEAVSISGADAVISDGNFMAEFSITAPGASISGGTFYSASLNGANSKISGGTFSWEVTVKDSPKSISGGSFNLTLTNQSGIVEDLLADGYAFKHHDGYGGGSWVTEAERANEKVSSVDVKQAPITAVLLTSDAKNNTAEYGQKVKLTSSCTTSSGYGDASQTWYSVDDDGETAEIGPGENLELTGLSVGEHKYRVTYTCDGYSKSAEITIKVTALDISTATVTPEALTYTGSEQTPTVDVTLGGKPLTAGTDYDVTVTPQKDAGSYKLTVTGKGNYTGEIKDIDWAISPVELTITDVTVPNKDYDGTTGAMVTGVEFSGLVSGESVDYTAVGVFDTANAGKSKTVTVTVTLGDDVKNYTLTDDTFKKTGCEINKATVTAPFPATLTIINGVDRTYEIALPTLPTLGENETYGNCSYVAYAPYFSDKAYAATAELDSNTAPTVLKLTVTATGSTTGEQIGFFEMLVTTENYTDIHIFVYVRASDKLKPTGEPTMSPDRITYGDELSKITLSGSLKDPDTLADIEGTFAWKDGAIKPRADALNYQTMAEWVFTPTDENAYMYETVTGEILVHVDKADFTNVSVQDVTLTYTGEEQTANVITSATPVDGKTTPKFLYSADPDRDRAYYSSVPAFTDAGTYTIYYLAIDTNANHNDFPGQFTITIEPKVVTSPTIVLEGAPFTYTGEEIKPNVIVKDGDRVIDPKEYTVSFENNTNAGTATVTIADKDGGNYIVSGSTTFNIAKADVKITKVPEARTLTYNGEEQALITAGEAEGGALKYGLGTLGDTIPTMKNAGTYTVYYKVFGDANHNDSAQQSMEVTVKQSPVTVTAKDKSVYVGSTAPVLPVEPVKDTDYTVSEMYGTDTLEGTVTLTYDGTPDMTKAGTATIKISGTLANDNYTVTYADGKLTISARPSSSGGGGGSTTYPVNTPNKTENGTVTVSPKNASKGNTVTVTVTPDKGYELDTITVKDASGNTIKLTDKGNGKYTFTMPGSKVTVSAEFTVIQADAIFADVPADAYYANAVEWAVKNGITNGKGNGLFGSNDPCTRGQIVTFLWRAAGSPEPKNTASFTDVPADSYYAKAVAWAIENGITMGTTDTTFSPDAVCTRAQSVTFLYRTLGKLAGSKTVFSDVPADSYYADAVAWAVENGVTNGTSATTFSPADSCTRAQIVTFLYRAYQGK